MARIDRRELLALGCAMLLTKAGSAQEPLWERSFI